MTILESSLVRTHLKTGICKFLANNKRIVLLKVIHIIRHFISGVYEHKGYGQATIWSVVPDGLTRNLSPDTTYALEEFP